MTMTSKYKKTSKKEDDPKEGNNLNNGYEIKNEDEKFKQPQK